MLDAAASKPRRPVALSYVAIAGTVLTWAAAFPAIAIALRDVTPLPMAAARFAIAACFAAAWLAWRKPPRMSVRDYALTALCGVLGIAIYGVLLNLGQLTVSAGAASFIVNTQPVLMASMAGLFLKERLGAWAWLGTAVGFLGVALIAQGQPGGLEFGAGSSLVFAAALCTAVASVMQKPLVARNDPLHVSTVALIAAPIALTPWLPAGIKQLATASSSAVVAVAFLAIAPAAIGTTCWNYALGTLGAARTGQFLYLIPPLATAMSWAWLGDVPSASILIGGGLALGGVVLFNTVGRR